MKRKAEADVGHDHRHSRRPSAYRAWHWVIRPFAEQDPLVETTRNPYHRQGHRFLFSAGSGTAKVLIAEWTDPRTNTTYQFRTYVPQSAQAKLGESVDVLIDPEHPERYTVTSVESLSMKKR